MISDIITDVFQLNILKQKLQEAKIIAFDFETTGLDFLTDDILGLSLATDTGLNVYIPFRHSNTECMDEDYIVQQLKPIFESPDNILVAHNLKFDIQFLWNTGINIDWKVDHALAADTQIMSFLLDENRDSHALKVLMNTILHIDSTKFDVLTKHTRFYDLPMEIASKYAKLDALATLKLYQKFLAQMEKEKLVDVFWKVEMRYCKVIALMERRGVYVDLELLNEYEKRIFIEVNIMEKKLNELAGMEINLNSGDQLGKLLFGKPEEGGFGAPIIAWTDGGKKPNKKTGKLAPPKPKTDADSIEELAKMSDMPWSEFCRTLLRYKELGKIDSTYIKGLRTLIRIDGKLHCSINQTVAVTGRTSASEPNLQNQPAGPTWEDEYYPGVEYKRWQLYTTSFTGEVITMPGTLEEVKALFPRHGVEEIKADKEKGIERHFKVNRKIRDIYYNPHGVLVVSDYSQMEMRMMAHFSEDPGLLEAFEKRVDIHKYVASKAFSVPIDEVSKKQRQQAKAVGFGTIFGKTVFGFAKDWYGHEHDFRIINPKTRKFTVNKKYLNMAQEFLDDFFAAFGGVKAYIDKTEAYCKKYGFIKTLTGRKRRLPAIYAMEEFTQARAKRQAINSKIQGSAADYIKMAQILLEERLEDSGIEQCLQVHDEIVMTCPSVEIADRYTPVVVNTMTTVVNLRLEIETEPTTVTRWGMAK